MKLRITDLLDDYMDDDLPLEPMPQPEKQERPRMTRIPKPRRGKKYVQIAAGLLLAVSLSAVGWISFRGGASSGESLAAAGEAQEAPEASMEPSPEVAAEDTQNESLQETDGYFITSIGTLDQDITIMAEQVVRDGLTFTATMSMESNLQRVSGFNLEDAETFLVLSDGTQVYPTSASSESGGEDPFTIVDTYDFTGAMEESQLSGATLYMQIYQVTIQTEDGQQTVEGDWSVLVTEDAVAQADALPEAVLEPAPAAALDPEQDFFISDVTVSATGCSFWLHTRAEEYVLAPLGQLELAAENNMDATCYGFAVETEGSANLGELTLDTAQMATMGVTNTQNLVKCTVSWAEEIDPAAVTGLFFTDGTASVVADVDVYEY